MRKLELSLLREKMMKEMSTKQSVNVVVGMVVSSANGLIGLQSNQLLKCFGFLFVQ